MADKKSNLKDAVMALAREIDSVFKKFTKQTRLKAWAKIMSKDGEKEIKRILDNPGRGLSPFARLASQKESTDRVVRVWLDDERPMPNEFSLHARTADEAIKAIEAGGVSVVSLDHDLGEDSNGTGYDVAKFIEEGAFLGTVPPMEVRVHSANPVGASRMRMCIENAKRYWA